MATLKHQVTLAVNAAEAIIAYTAGCTFDTFGKMYVTINPKNLPNTAPNTNCGPNTPAGIGQDRARIVSVNFRKQKTMRLKATAGWFHLRFSWRGVLENMVLRILRSPCRMYMTA